MSSNVQAMCFFLFFVVASYASWLIGNEASPVNHCTPAFVVPGIGLEASGEPSKGGWFGKWQCKIW